MTNSSALGSFDCIFENNSLKALFGQNIKKLKILKLSPDSRYLQKLALNSLLCSLHNWSSVVLVSLAILASFYIPVSLHYGNNALCKIHKVSNLASLDVI